MTHGVSIVTSRITTHSVTTLSITTLGIMPMSIMPVRITLLSITKISIMTLNNNKKCYIHHKNNSECHYCTYTLVIPSVIY